MSENEKIIPFEELPITNNFMFCQVMSDPGICKEFIEKMLKIKIERIVYINSEQTIASPLKTKSIRLDVYMKDENRAFDLEMQVSNTGDLPKRTRYYQSLIDIDCLKNGEHYKDLKESYIIFIMPMDIFGLGLPKYEFENLCIEEPALHLNDNTKKIFYNFNAFSKSKDEDEKNILEFFATENETNTLTERMSNLLNKTRLNVSLRKNYMTLEMQKHFWDIEAEERGFAKGRAEAQAIIDEQKSQLTESISKIAEQKSQLSERDAKISNQEAEIAELKAKLAELQK